MAQLNCCLLIDRVLNKIRLKQQINLNPTVHFGKLKRSNNVFQLNLVLTLLLAFQVFCVVLLTIDVSLRRLILAPDSLLKLFFNGEQWYRELSKEIPYIEQEFT